MRSAVSCVGLPLWVWDRLGMGAIATDWAILFTAAAAGYMWMACRVELWDRALSACE